LQVVVFGLKGMQIEENAREILERISSLKLVLNGVEENYEKLGTNITNTKIIHGTWKKLGSSRINSSILQQRHCQLKLHRSH